MKQDLNNEDAQALIDAAARNQILSRNVFSTHDGQELLALWKEFYVMCDLYGQDDRAMVYAVAQRDFVLEVEAATKRRT